MGKHLLSCYADEIWELSSSKRAKKKFQNKEKYKPFKDRSLAMIFAKLSGEPEFHLKLVLRWVEMLVSWPSWNWKEY